MVTTDHDDRDQADISNKLWSQSLLPVAAHAHTPTSCMQLLAALCTACWPCATSLAGWLTEAYEASPASLYNHS